MKPLVVAYYTKNTPYEDEAKSLRLSLDALKLEHYILGIDNLGSWQKNTQYKPRFLKHCLERYPNRPLLYIDVDAIVIKYPTEIQTLQCDLAATRYPNRGDVQSGTLFLGATGHCRYIIDQWIAMNERYPEKLPDGREAWDQRTLTMIINNVMMDYRALPLEYCWICGYTARQYPHMSPVIVHTRGAYRLQSYIDDPIDEVLPWAVFPTINIDNARKVTQLWKDAGYRICVLVEEDLKYADTIGADRILKQRAWTSFPHAANLLCKSVDGPAVVVIGDDIHPNPYARGPELARRFLARFPDTMGVVQPVGDQYGSIMKCAVSPWIGRKFIEKVYHGQGPYYTGYYHYFSDQELQGVAQLLGCFYQDPDIKQYHDHWQRKNMIRPEYLMIAKSRWEQDRSTYQNRKVQNYPGHEVKS